MAEELDTFTTFTPGQVVTCTTCFEQNLEGEVVAFDYERRVLVIKTPSVQQPNHHDVHLVNTDCVSGIEIKKEAKNGSQPVQKIIVQKVDNRVREAVAERKAIHKAFTEGVSEEGLRLFLTLSKTLGRDVSWRGKDIFVNQVVLIRHPYRSENCAAQNENTRNDKTIAYVQQLVNKHWADAPGKQNCNGSSPDSPSDSRRAS